ncbi:MAG: UDP-N-acetylglucosamine 1-carboxyvinyltransferase [Planctomycetota bacterium]|jgi:UDP-N-acetylglucosamine 1-carboxyvinyltransferase
MTDRTSTDRFRIIGGIPLSGEVRVSGSKNAALPMMAATILADGPVRLDGVPRLADVDTMSRLLGNLGVEATRTPDGGMRLHTRDATPVRAGYELVRRMRASFCVLGPLLARRGKAVVSLPGGCNIGPRPVDLHLRGLAALGADLRIRRGYVVARARKLVGSRIRLTGRCGSTVTGTANVMTAATLARGVTVITGAAVEPEIVDLGQLLNRMGADVTGLGSATIRIRGVRQLGGTSHRVIPDRVEAATLLLAAAITGGSITVAGTIPGHLEAVIERLHSAGFAVRVWEDRIRVADDRHRRPVDVTAMPYPGIPTDVQAQWMALLTLAPGQSTVCDRVFPGRFLHVAELNRLGARIRMRNGAALVTGVQQLTGARVAASDLRASAALVLAGLAARGETIVDHVRHLDRGYEQLDRKLRRLGADVCRESGGPRASPRPRARRLFSFGRTPP